MFGFRIWIDRTDRLKLGFSVCWRAVGELFRFSFVVIMFNTTI